MKKFSLLTFFFITLVALSQETANIKKDSTLVNPSTINGKVLNASNNVVLENVHVVNLNSVKGTLTNEDGNFMIKATVNDTIYFSYLGFKSIRVRVTNDWMKFGEIKIKMTELSIALEEVVVKPVELTGYIEVDAKLIPIYDDQRYRIAGIGGGYEGGQGQPGAVTKVLSAIFNPADFLYNIFGKRPKQMKKLRKMKDDDEIRNLLQSKYDRETLMAVLQLEKIDIDEILNNCSYSKSFIRTANDLQILDAISECYEQYRVLNRGRK
ncbi:MAG: carboxypeptidase-like regulatory domain-containing protein [Flavobacteriales bacterium]|nr:MAG: carboxypeptidase-like regulatory domain-containing protein [Flavobacteriales bacterium]